MLKPHKNSLKIKMVEELFCSAANATTSESLSILKLSPTRTKPYTVTVWSVLTLGTTGRIGAFSSNEEFTSQYQGFWPLLRTFLISQPPQACAFAGRISDEITNSRTTGTLPVLLCQLTHSTLHFKRVKPHPSPSLTRRGRHTFCIWLGLFLMPA